jgi:hypothetical protein
LRDAVRITHWLFDFLYGAVPAEFESAFGLEDSVRRLSDATGRWPFAALTTKQMAGGRVTATRVILQRVIPFVGNSFKPFFLGAFRVEGTRVVLTGKFTMHSIVKIFFSLWFGFLALSIPLIFLQIAVQGGSWWEPFGAIGMFCAGLGLVGLGKWFARNDIAWLSDVIRKALASQ